MIKDITYCDDISCPCEHCERHMINLEGKGLSEEDLSRISKAAFTECNLYGTTAGRYVPM